MGELISFPGRPYRDWALIEKSIREVLQESNASMNMQNTICVRIKEFFVKFNKEFNWEFSLKVKGEEEAEEIKKEVEKNASIIQQQIQSLFNEILFDRLLLEIEIYNLKSQDE